MSTKTLLSNRPKLLAAVILAAALFVGAAIIAEANSPFDIEFPVPELGNCAGKTECKAYCDNPENEEACQAFAEKHKLGATREEVGEKFKVIEEDGGPGGCAADSENPRKSCEEYCGKRENMRACVAYAKEHSLMDSREIEEAEKVIKALDSGVSLPAACTDERSCKATCDEPKDVETMRQCFAFAEAAGLLPPGVDKEKAEKMFKAIEEGRAPFKSPRDFEQCENPPSDEVFQKCIDFAIENGMLPPEEAEMVKKTGGKGPGGCRGKEQCETYCEEHQDECFAFAEEHGLVKEEDRERMKEGMTKFKEALDSAPPEVVECIRSAVGGEVLDQISAGTKPPSRDLGEKMHQCFESFFSSKQGQFGDQPPSGEGEFMMGGPDGRPEGGEGRGGERGGPGYPPEVKACLEEKLGAEGFQELTRYRGDPMNSSYGEVLRGCFETSFKGGSQGMGNGESHQGQMPEADRRVFEETQKRMMDERREVERRMIEERMREASGGEHPYPPPAGFGEGGGDFRPPEGGYPENYMPPSGGSYTDPSGSQYTYPTRTEGSDGSYTPPPTNTDQPSAPSGEATPTESAPPAPAPEAAPAPESSPSSLFFYPVGMNRLMANVLSFFLGQ